MASNRLRPAVASALEGALLAGAAGAAAWATLEPGVRDLVVAGLCAAWGVSTASIAALAFFRERSFRTFLRAFGAGVALRASVLVALVIATWGEGWDGQAPLLGAYALGTLVLFTFEVRHLGFEKKR